MVEGRESSVTDQKGDGAVAKEEAAVDALVAAISPRLSAPITVRRDVVLVTGPWLSGVSSVVKALTKRLPKRTFVESTDLAAGEAPTIVVFVVSAAAALTESDCLLLDAATADTDVVIGAVSKIDVHRNWRDLLAANREVLAAHAPRYRDVPWVGVAAAPDSGKPRVDDLVAAVREQLADADHLRRNRLRAWESRLRTVADRHDREADGAGRRARVEALREQRSALLRQRRASKSERTIALRSQTQQARVQLSYFARNRCASVRSELQEDAGSLARGQLPDFEANARGRIDEVALEVDEGITTHLVDVAQNLGLAVDPPATTELPTIEIPTPQLKSRRLENRLMMLVGAGFGLGVALALSRLLAGLTPGLTIAGTVACAAIGVGLTVWVVATRGLLRDRALLDRWAGEATAQLRSALEQLVATRVLAAETALTAALGERDEAESAQVTEQVGVIDTELREHAVVGARAAALRGREMPTLQAALAAVRAELGEPAEPRSEPEADTPSQDAAATDGGDVDISESPSANAADNVF
jgi:hypothetical protein